MLKELVLLSGLLLGVVPAFCSNFYIDEMIEVLNKKSLQSVNNDELMQLTKAITNTMQSEDIASLYSSPRLYTETVNSINLKIKSYPKSVRSELAKKLHDLKNSLYLDANSNIPQFNCENLIGHGTLQVLLNDSEGYINLAKAVPRFDVNGTYCEDAIKFLKLYMSKSGNLPIIEIISHERSKISSQVSELIKGDYANLANSNKCGQEELNKVLKTIEQKLAMYFNDIIVEQAKLGGFPALNSQDKNALSLLKYKFPNDFVQAYAHFVWKKYVELAKEYQFGMIHFSSRTTYTQVRQDIEKAVNLLNDGATKISNKFGGTSAAEKKTLKNSLLDLSPLKILIEALEDDTYGAYVKFEPALKSESLEFKY